MNQTPKTEYDSWMFAHEPGSSNNDIGWCPEKHVCCQASTEIRWIKRSLLIQSNVSQPWHQLSLATKYHIVISYSCCILVFLFIKTICEFYWKERGNGASSWKTCNLQCHDFKKMNTNSTTFHQICSNIKLYFCVICTKIIDQPSKLTRHTEIAWSAPSSPTPPMF